MNQRDHVDGILAQWARERPDLDVSPIGVIGRISRLSRHLEAHLTPVFKQFGINNGEYDVLATLRRAGKPHRLTPTQLFQSAMLTSGAMTHRLDRLEHAGLIKRQPDPNDRRSVLVALTAKGLKLMDKVASAHYANERQLLAACTKSERATLEKLLKKLLLGFEQQDA